jgi:hypothetical protein
MPLALVNAVPDDGTNTPVLSVVVKVTAMFGAAFPLLSFTTALSVAALSGETDEVVAPDASINESVSGAVDSVVADVADVVEEVPEAHDGRFGSRAGSRVVHALLPPPPPQATINPASMPTAHTFAFFVRLEFSSMFHSL